MYNTGSSQLLDNRLEWKISYISCLTPKIFPIVAEVPEIWDLSTLTTNLWKFLSSANNQSSNHNHKINTKLLFPTTTIKEMEFLFE